MLISFVAAALVVWAVLWLPGMLVLRVAGLPLLWAIAAAPVVGVVAVVGVGFIAHLVSWRVDGPLGPVLLLAVTLALALIAHLTGSHVSCAFRVPHRVLPTLGAWCATTFAFAIGFVLAIKDADAWPQAPDSVFHVGASTWMVRHGSAWIGDVTQYVAGSQGASAYPGVWHSIVSVGATWSGQSALVTSHALVVLTAGAIWPSAVTVLAWRVSGTSSTTSIVAALFVFVFYGMPFHGLAWGVLWPYLLGMALLPWAFRGAYHLVDSWQLGWRSRARSSAVVILLWVVTFFCHPSIAFIAALVLPLVVIPPLWPGLTRGGRIAIVGVAGAALAALWTVRPEGMVEFALERTLSLGDALRRVPEAASVHPVVGVVALAAAVAAALISCRRRSTVWIPILLSLSVLGNSLLAVLPPEAYAALTWPWFGDEGRLVVLTALPAVLALTAFTVSRARTFDSLSNSRPAHLGTALIAAVLVVNVALSFVVVHLHYYPPSPEQYWITPEGRVELAELARHIPPNAVVAADPFRGGTHLYLSRDVDLAFPTEWGPTADTDLRLIAEGLDRASVDEGVCAALRRRAVEFVVSGGVQASTAEDSQLRMFAGFDHIDAAGGFTRTAAAGRYTLWSPPAHCLNRGG